MTPLSPVCAKFNKVHMTFHDVRSRGLCGGLVYFDSPDFIFTEAHPDVHEQYHTMDLTKSLEYLCSADRRLRFIYLQTGLHRYGNVSNIFKVFLEPRIRMIQRTVDDCKYYIKDLIRIVFVDETSPFSIEDYRSTKDTTLGKFNKGLEPPLKSRLRLTDNHNFMTSLISAYPQVSIINFRAFVAEANISSTYDGLSSLTDVNAMKALYILHLMDKLYQEYRIKTNKRREETAG